ncbi:hypothetical protein Lal_00023001 [Lupinus albus]|uniref:Uncharacterized protein n=1 Tax=Lupinus albus TaxID=3870 RepID=A0A6A5N0U5_LUPAL|nr:hypothetical protein Lalb_Chr20g0110261 [Lupinus albus]KAF1880971.1 hypothetical protein Lal_00023001 [Lupinus albus]
MAGLQQYNFFPTDLFYPRSKPQPSSNPTVVIPLQNPNTTIEDKNQQQQSLPRSMVKVNPCSSPPLYIHKRQQSLSRVHKKVSKFPLSWVVFMDQDQEDSKAF